jgi:hypothetical protein
VGLAVSAAVLLVTSYVAGGLPAVLITVFVVCVFGLLWFVLPLARRRSRRPAGLRLARALMGSRTRRRRAVGGQSGSYADWTKPDLVKRAREIGIKGRPAMSKAELVKALGCH